MREIALCALVLGLAAAAVFGSYVGHGGFHLDDWQIAAYHAFRGLPEPSNALHRPLLEPLLELPFAVVGLNSSLQLAWGLLLGCVSATVAFVLLRILEIEGMGAMVIALLVLLFPLSDSVRLLASWAPDTVAVSLYLLGAIVGLSGLELRGRRAVLRHLIAVLLYAASILTFDIGATAVAASGLLYRTRAPWSVVRPRWRADVVTVAVTVAVLALVAPSSYPVQSPVSSVAHAGVIAVQAVAVGALALVPPGGGVLSRARVAVALVVATALLAALLLAARQVVRQRSEPASGELRRWARVAVAGVVAAAAAYLVLVPAVDYYHPLARGEANRVNLLAAFAIAVFVYGLARVAAVCVTSRWARRRDRSGQLAAALCALLAIAYLPPLVGDEHRWERATALEAQVLRAVGTAIRSSRGAQRVLYAVDYRSQVAPGVPVFAADDDFDAALRITFRNPSLSGRPVGDPRRLRCERAGLMAPELETSLTPYDRALIVDVSGNASARVGSAAECERLLERVR